MNPYPHPEDLWEPRPHRPGPVDRIQARARVTVRDGRTWITYPTEVRRGRTVTAATVEMPNDAPTQSCHDGRHHQCNHRRGAPHEGGVWLKITKPAFLWRCGCRCHSHPEDIGLLF